MSFSLNCIISNCYFFSDSVVQALQFLDVINMKDPNQKGTFYRTTLIQVLPHIPKVCNLAKLYFIPYHPHASPSTYTKGM